ncbi:Gfo/Idh/MocA family protein [Thermus sp. NMX2.A1]|uniref:Gfo/Idh/MocA family protein n=1 Tax=Thermus sp. NMX2.A1 TaxID=570924 RepID=UPI0003DDE42A|nr:Gfo/Idh/MocA family oxidoreductase [Thermus sp. NMX2.A1]ETN89025.1 oxidoreductase [Thermus sp. NMX2.A1]
MAPSLVFLGAGNRGMAYAHHAHALGARIAGVADPRPERFQAFREAFSVERTFADWREVLEAPLLGEAAVIALPDRLHAEAAVALMEKGYHLLLEKPIAPTWAEVERVAQAKERAGRLVAVAHVLRYTPYAQALKGLLREGAVGEVVSVQHLEPVGHWHYAHSFVRGNWRKEEESSPFLLAKSVHDLDWLLFVMPGEVNRVASFGGLFHFRPENRPNKAASRCLECPEQVERNCPFSARRIYLEAYEKGERGWPLDVVAYPVTWEGLVEALRGGPYGECVYLGKNDVADHQVVVLEYREGQTASLHVEGLSRMRFRETRVFGTEGELFGDGERIWVHHFLRGERVVEVGRFGEASVRGGHGGGDGGLVEAFLRAVALGEEGLLEPFAEAVYAHRLTFLAEEARRTGRVVAVESPRP